VLQPCCISRLENLGDGDAGGFEERTPKGERRLPDRWPSVSAAFVAFSGALDYVDDDDEDAGDDEQDDPDGESATEEDGGAEPSHAVHGDVGLVRPYVRGHHGSDVDDEEVGDTPRGEDRAEIYERRFGVELLLDCAELGEDDDEYLVEKGDGDSNRRPRW